MITRQDLITAIRVKMDSDPLIEDDYYNNYYDTLIDECLSIVANTVLPYQECMTIKWGGYIDSENDLASLDKNCYYTFGIDIASVDAKRKDWYEYDGTKWVIQRRNTYGYLAKIPFGFLSFSDEASVEFYNTDDELVSLNTDILYVNSKLIALSKDGTYKIYYNSEYPKTNGNVDLPWIPTNVAKIIPAYVAGQLLSSEDPIKSTQLKNEFELMLSRLDANKPLVPYNIINKDGWVL